jgi:hypothetical protein
MATLPLILDQLVNRFAELVPPLQAAAAAEIRNSWFPVFRPRGGLPTEGSTQAKRKLILAGAGLPALSLPLRPGDFELDRAAPGQLDRVDRRRPLPWQTVATSATGISRRAVSYCFGRLAFAAYAFTQHRRIVDAE